jgi:DNA-binding LacI/PurR family transcriptional regulator
MTNPAETKCEKLVVELTGLIESGVYRPHEKFFSVEKLQKRYEVSRTTVIEIFKRLEADGRIYRKPKSGTYVSPPQKVRQVLLVASSSRHENHELNAFFYHTEQDASQAQNFKINYLPEKDFLRDLDYLEIVHRNVVGVIFFRLHDTFAAVRDQLEAKKILPVFYGSSMHRPRLGMRNCCYYEEKAVVHAILDRLYRAGHRQIGCISFLDGVFGHRKQLYIEWMIEHGLFIDQRNLLECASGTIGFVHADLMARNPADLGFTAFFATHYGLGIEAIGALGCLGVKIPEQAAIIGIGDSPACRFVIPRLTSLLIDHNGDAARIIRQLAAAIGDPAAEIGGSSRIGFLEGQTG